MKKSRMYVRGGRLGMQCQPGMDWWGFFLQQRPALENIDRHLSVSDCHILEHTGMQQ